MLNHSYQSYRQQSVMTMTPSDMLTMLYDAILKELEISKRAFEKKDYAEVNRGLQKIQAILRYLKGVLDFKYEISTNLDALYDYFIRVTIEANVKKDPSRLDEVGGFVSELRSTYIQANHQVQTKDA